MVVSTLGANDLLESTKLPAIVGQLLDQDELDMRSVEISNLPARPQIEARK